VAAALRRGKGNKGDGMHYRQSGWDGILVQNLKDILASTEGGGKEAIRAGGLGRGNSSQENSNSPYARTDYQKE